MKTRTALPIFFALSFLMVSAVNAQVPPAPLTPDELVFSLDTAFITSDLGQSASETKTIRGSIQNLNPASNGFRVNIQTSRQWVVQTKINGVVMNDGDPLSLSTSQPVPVEITLVPYAEGPDTESYCVSVMYGSKLSAYKCITLALTNNTSAVSPDLLASNITLSPNPASNFISLRGVDDIQAGYRYEIYSISGAEVRHGSLPADARIGVQDLNSGAYRLLLFDTKQLFYNTAFTVLH